MSSELETHPAPKAPKDLSVETLRGLAVLLLVAAHVVGNDSTSGMRVDDRSGYRYFYFSFEYFRMPLFTVISGFIYSLRPVSASFIGKFLKGKARRILVPMVVVGTLQYALHMLPGVNEPKALKDIWKIYVFAFDQFWFLQAIFLVFVTVMILDCLKWLDDWSSWLLWTVAAMAVYLLLPYSWLPHLNVPEPRDLFSGIGYLKLLPFFLVGCGLQRHREFLFRPLVLAIIAVAFVAGVILQQGAWFGWTDLVSTDPRSILSVLIGLGGSVLLFRYRRDIPFLSRIGKYAYSIFLFHVWSMAGVRVIGGKLGLEGPLLFVLSLIAGLAFPIVVEWVCVRNRILRRLLLGLK